MNYNKENEAVLNTLEIGLRPGNRPEDIPSWLREYLNISVMPQGPECGGYASIDGKIVAATYWEGDASFESEQTEWYQKAIEADGDIDLHRCMHRRPPPEYSGNHA